MNDYYQGGGHGCGQRSMNGSAVEVGGGCAVGGKNTLVMRVKNLAPQLKKSDYKLSGVDNIITKINNLEKILYVPPEGRMGGIWEEPLRLELRMLYNLISKKDENRDGKTKGK